MALFLYTHHRDLFIQKNNDIFPFYFSRKMTLKLYLVLSGILFLNSFPSTGQEAGLQLNSFGKDFSSDAPQAMKKVKELGFSYVEMNGTYGLSFPQFIKLLAVNGLSAVSFETSFENLAESPQAVADQARSYGAKYIVCPSPRMGALNEEDVKKISQGLNHAGKILAQNGLLLCYHANGKEFLSMAGETIFDHLVEQIDPRFVYLAMNVFTIKEAGKEPIDFLKKYPTRFILVYLKDGQVGSDNAKTRDTHVSLGTGDVGILEIMRTARELGIQYFFLEEDSENAEQRISESLAFLKTINYQSRK
jgi:sugar phosphate isomerase/epimerase